MDVARGRLAQEHRSPTRSTALEREWKRPYDFYFLHVKGTDSAGEDGDEERKARVIEEFDRELPRIRALTPDVILITGDHSTPGPMKGHSWHGVPFLLHGPWVEPDDAVALRRAVVRKGRFGGLFPVAVPDAGRARLRGQARRSSAPSVALGPAVSTPAPHPDSPTGSASARRAGRRCC